VTFDAPASPKGRQAPAPPQIYSHVYGLVVSADVRLPELISSKNTVDDIAISSLKRLDGVTEPPFMTWTTPPLGPWLSFHKSNGGYLLRFRDTADFQINGEGTRIEWARLNGAPENTLRHLLLDQVLPMVLNLRGGEALHASAVMTPEGAIAFCGSTGSGKSTLAAIFASHGDTVVTDDCLPICAHEARLYGAPGYPGLRLWQTVVDEMGWSDHAQESVAHYTAKLRALGKTPAANFPLQEFVLRAIYILEPLEESSGVEFVELSPRDRMMGLLSYAFRLDVTDRMMLARQFQRMEAFAGMAPIRKLCLPRNAQRIPNMRERILADVKELGPRVGNPQLPRVLSKLRT
jgi:hypothetical protein